MKFGICTGELDKLKEMDCDFCEMGLAAINAMDEEAFLKLHRKNTENEIKVIRANGFFPADILLVGKELDLEKVASYTKRALERASFLGIEICVLGSGRSRTYPEAYGKELASGDFINVLKLVGDIAKEYGIVVAIEPLSYGETNLINTFLEGLEIVREVGHPNVKIMADFYHMTNNKENINSLKEAGSDLVHMHVASAKRRFPKEENRGEFIDLFRILREMDYRGTMSIEAIVDNLLKEGKEAIRLLRSVQR